MEKFLGSAILVLVASFIVFIKCELKESNRKRQFQPWENFVYPLIVFSGISILIWVTRFAITLLS